MLFKKRWALRRGFISSYAGEVQKCKIVPANKTPYFSTSRRPSVTRCWLGFARGASFYPRAHREHRVYSVRFGVPIWRRVYSVTPQSAHSFIPWGTTLYTAHCTLRTRRDQGVGNKREGPGKGADRGRWRIGAVSGSRPLAVRGPRRLAPDATSHTQAPYTELSAPSNTS